MTTTDIIEAGLEAMAGFGMSTDVINDLPTPQAQAQAILLAIESETEDTRLIELLNSITC